MTRLRIYLINSSKSQKWGQIIFSSTMYYDLKWVIHILTPRCNQAVLHFSYITC